jgi:hypothetical protein
MYHWMLLSTYVCVWTRVISPVVFQGMHTSIALDDDDAAAAAVYVVYVVYVIVVVVRWKSP